MRVYDFILISKYARSAEYLRPTRHHYYASALSKRGYKVLLLTSQSNLGKKIKSANMNYEYIELPGLKVERGFSMRRIFSWVQFELFLFFWLLHSNVTAKYLWVSSLSIITPWTVFWKFKKSTRILEIRDIYPETLISSGKISQNGFLAQYLRFFEGYAHRNADLIVSSLDNYEVYLNEYFPNLSKQYFWLPTGADKDFYSLERRKLTKSKSLAYAGTIGFANDVEFLLKVFNNEWLKSNDLKFYIYGDGPLRKNLQKTYASDFIFFRGLVDKSDLPAVLSEHNCLLNSWRPLELYKYGVSPNKWVEYALSGRPVMLALNYYSPLFNQVGLGKQVRRDCEQMRECVLELVGKDFSSVEDRFFETLNYDVKTHELLDKIL